MQLTHTKAAEIEDYLRRLSDINGRLAACLVGANDTRSPMLTRHRDILHDYTQVGWGAWQALHSWGSQPSIAAMLHAVVHLPWCPEQALCTLQEFRRLTATLGEARDRANLFTGSSESAPLAVSQIPRVSGVHGTKALPDYFPAVSALTYTMQSSCAGSSHRGPVTARARQHHKLQCCGKPMADSDGHDVYGPDAFVKVMLVVVALTQFIDCADG
jgi:hypothetical protein